MNADAMISTLMSLKLPCMAESVADLAARSLPAYRQAVPVLEKLLMAEVAEREVRSINYQMKAAKFPASRDLAGFEYNQSRFNKALVRSLKRYELQDDAQNIVLVDGPASGKIHLVTAIAMQGIQHHRFRV